MRQIFLIVTTIFLFSACSSWFPNPFSSNAFEVREGYLSLGKINENIAKQLPLTQKVGQNSIKITSVVAYAGEDKKSLIVDSEFIFTSFEIPEGVGVVARAKSSISYDPQTKEFHFANVKVLKLKFLKEELLEYVSPMQEKFIVDGLKYELENLILHKSRKRLKPIKSISVKEGKIKVVFQ